MSIYYSKFSLNVYPQTTYFKAHLPAGFPLDDTLRACRSFRKLPPRLKELATKSKEWARANGLDPAGISQYYNDDGDELDPATGRPLTLAEVNASWRPGDALTGFHVTDIPKPKGGFPDPETWQPEDPTAPAGTELRVTKEQLREDIAKRGVERVSKDYGIPVVDLLPELRYIKQDEIVLGVATGEKWKPGKTKTKKGR